MINRNIKLILAMVFTGLIIFINLPISTIILVLLLGMLIIPPALVFLSVFKEGAPVILRELQEFVDSGKNFFVISVSRESITLEPQFK